MAKQVHSPDVSRSSEESVFDQYSENELVINKTKFRNSPDRYDLTPEVETILPPCKPLAESGHSLEADMLFG